jgi:hypothetical protein
MTLDQFQVIIDTLKKQKEAQRTLYSLKVDLLEFTDPYESVITTLFTEIYGLEGYDWFGWFCYENDFGSKMSKRKPKAWDKDGKPICYDVKSLWTYLETECKRKK